MVAALTLRIFYRQLDVMSRTLSVMESSSSQTSKLIALYASQANSVKVLAQQPGNILDQMKDQSTSMRTSATASANQADAAKGAVETAKKSLQSSIEQFRSDQRPWVVPFQFRLSGELEAFKDFTVNTLLQNTGKTPAIDVVNVAQMSISHEPPAQPVFLNLVPIMTRGILSPGQMNFFATLQGFILSPAAADSYSSGKSKLYVFAEIRYRDINQKMHWTRYCIVHQHGKPLDEFNFSDTGNDMDGQ